MINLNRKEIERNRNCHAFDTILSIETIASNIVITVPENQQERILDFLEYFLWNSFIHPSTENKRVRQDVLRPYNMEYIREYIGNQNWDCFRLVCRVFISRTYCLISGKENATDATIYMKLKTHNLLRI